MRPIEIKTGLFSLAAVLLISITSFAGIPGSRNQPLVDTAHYYMKHSFDVLNYKLDLDLYNCYNSPPTKEFNANEIITFRIDSTLSSIFLNAVNSSLTIISVAMDGISFTHHNDTLRIQLSRTFNPGETAVILIKYRHNNVTDQAFYAAGGYVFTDTPPEGSRKWFPCWDRPSDKALLDLTAKVPADVKLGSNGRLADSLLVADTLWYHWVSRDPISTYLITLSSKVNFLLDIVYWNNPSNPSDSIPIRFYYKYPEQPAAMQQLIIPMTTFFSEKFGVYPFEKGGFATLNSYFPWGGMENQTMINLKSNGWQEKLISHEYAHMWFGDLITCGTWADVWLNEGFATYCEALWKENQTGYEDYKSHLNSQANYYLQANPGLPLYNPEYAIQTPDPNTLYDLALVYYKGACVLHQLRYLLGDSVFFGMMHSYGTDTNFMYKNAITEDLIGKVNQVSGQDLTWYFHDWVYQANHPVYENTFQFFQNNDTSWNVVFRMRQTQQEPSFFKMAVPLQIVFSDQSDTLIRVINDSNDQLFEFTFTKEPTNVIFDPFRDILLKEATTVMGINDRGTEWGYSLNQNIPNPFKGTTQISYKVPKPSDIKISVFDSSGNLLDKVVDRFHEAGEYSFRFNDESISPGIYFYKLEADNFSVTRRMILAK